ncbi:hypothetical protein J1605_013483 [Eschrichtius robustus]|uniref:cGMP-dependent protein kinase interacting domain-containing protein n=1 Tax=Eschrichtius robustus TaxID=9764 RepID=A0AB34GFU0_ESCRO|nr:hypothetical protein J1605_013483 [Eschrichtius robustus]
MEPLLCEGRGRGWASLDTKWKAREESGVPQAAQLTDDEFRLLDPRPRLQGSELWSQCLPPVRSSAVLHWCCWPRALVCGPGDGCITDPEAALTLRMFSVPSIPVPRASVVRAHEHTWRCPGFSGPEVSSGEETLEQLLVQEKERVAHGEGAVSAVCAEGLWPRAVLTELKSDNQRLKDENGALIRVISKLSK